MVFTFNFHCSNTYKLEVELGAKIDKVIVLCATLIHKNIYTIIANKVTSVRPSVTKMLELRNMRLELRHLKRAEGLVL